MTQRELYEVFLRAYISAAQQGSEDVIRPSPSASAEEMLASAIGIKLGTNRLQIPSMQFLVDDVHRGIDGLQRHDIELVDENGGKHDVHALGSKPAAGRYLVY